MGELEWVKITGGNGAEYADCAAFDRKGNYYVAGTYDKGVDFDGDYLWSDGNARQIFLAKMGEKKKTTVNPIQSPDESICELKIYPNPTDGNIYMSSDCLIDELSVYNPLGALLFEAKNLRLENLLDLSDVSIGVYIIKARSAEQLIIKKFVVK